MITSSSALGMDKHWFFKYCLDGQLCPLVVETLSGWSTWCRVSCPHWLTLEPSSADGLCYYSEVHCYIGGKVFVLIGIQHLDHPQLKALPMDCVFNMQYNMNEKVNIGHLWHYWLLSIVQAVLRLASASNILEPSSYSELKCRWIVLLLCNTIWMRRSIYAIYDIVDCPGCM